jgi:hypothetical protein
VAPQNNPRVSSSSLPNATRSDSRRPRAAGSGISSAAITCGMPVPSVPGKSRSRSRVMTITPTPTISGGRYGDRSIAA